MATDGLTTLVDPALVIKTSGIMYSVVVGISWVTYPYFERLIFFFLNLNVLILLVTNISLGVLSVVTSLSDSVLKRVVPFLRSGVDDRYIGRGIINIYSLNFLIGVFFDKMTLLSVL